MQLSLYQLVPKKTKKKSQNYFIFFKFNFKKCTFGDSGCPAISAIDEKCSFGTRNISQTILCFSANLARIDSSKRRNCSAKKIKIIKNPQKKKSIKKKRLKTNRKVLQSVQP